MNRALGSLGLAMKAGRVQSGEENCLGLIKSHRAFLLLIDGGISSQSRRNLVSACEREDVPLREIPSGDLGRAIGKENRMAAVITDQPFAVKLMNHLDNESS